MRQRDETVKFGGQKVKVQVHMTPNLRIWSSRISSFEYKQVYRRRYEIRRSSKPKTALKNNKIKYGEKRFSIWRMELLHPAMWHVALESWQWIHQVSAPCNVIRGSDMPWNSPKRPPYLNSTSGFDLDHITAVDCRHVILHQSAQFYSNRTTLSRINDVMSIFKMAYLSHLGF